MRQAKPQAQADERIAVLRIIGLALRRRAGRLGAARIRQELQSKGLGAEAVQDAVEEVRRRMAMVSQRRIERDMLQRRRRQTQTLGYLAQLTFGHRRCQPGGQRRRPPTPL